MKITDNTTRPWYDNAAGLTEALKDGLVGLHRICEARSEAGYGRKERLRWWCVLGAFVLDECGNTMRFTEGGPDYYTFNDIVPRVFTREDWEKSGDDRNWSMTIGHPPPHDDVCPHCLMGWTTDRESLKNYHWNKYGDKKVYHETCFRLKAEESERDYFINLLDKAIHYKSLRAIPNQYSRDMMRPWFIVETSVGPIKIGWRKSVMSIHWDKANIDIHGKDIAPEGVTSGESFAHAWGEDAAIGYLRKLIPPLQQLADINEDNVEQRVQEGDSDLAVRLFRAEKAIDKMLVQRAETREESEKRLWNVVRQRNEAEDRVRNLEKELKALKETV